MRREPLFLLLALVSGCGSGSPANGSPDAGNATGGVRSTESGGASSDGAAPTGGGSSSGGASSGGRAGSGGSGGGQGGTGGAPPASTGGPGCGLPSAAFCETFDAPAKTPGRAGELDSGQWAAGRLAPQLPSGNGCAIGIGPGTLPACRAGLPSAVFPDQDTLVCDAIPGILDRHLLVVTAAQNYGQNSYRIRQPFDFSGRTGKIVFDAEGFIVNGLLGWISVEVTEDPIDAPSFSIGDPGVNNSEGSLVPRNAVEIQFQSQCGGYSATPAVSVSMIDVLHDYADTVLLPQGAPTCVATERNKLNHFEIALSESHVRVSATPFSPDGKAFGPAQVLFETDAKIPFTRGWVHITTHNHATLKYSGPGSGHSDESLDAWTARWDNVGFDGPVVTGWREYEAPDSLTPGTNAWNRSGPIVNVGYRVADAKDSPNDTLHFRNVDLDGVTAARLSLSAWYLNSDPIEGYVLRHRLNGKAWHERRFTSGELSLLGGSHTQGQLGQILDVELSDLVQGDNTLEFTTVNVPQSYPPVVANVDLVLNTR